MPSRNLARAIGDRRPEPDGFVASRFVSGAEYAALRAHAALPAAAARFAGWLIETYSGNAVLDLVLSDRGRVLLGFFVLYLDVLPLPGSTQRGATLGSVQALCRRTGLCSDGRAASALALMRFGGYLTQADDPEDQRRRLLVPTARLTHAYHRNWVQQFEAMAPLFPDAAQVPARLETARFRTEFLRALGEDYLGGFRVVNHAPVLEEVAESNAALLMLASVALPLLPGGVPGEVAVSVSALARRFRVSRAHVRNVLRGAEAAGLIETMPGEALVRVRAALLEALLQLFGVLFLLFDRAAARAAAEAPN
jgi:hypothetical protein